MCHIFTTHLVVDDDGHLDWSCSLPYVVKSATTSTDVTIYLCKIIWNLRYGWVIQQSELGILRNPDTDFHNGDIVYILTRSG